MPGRRKKVRQDTGSTAANIQLVSLRSLFAPYSISQAAEIDQLSSFYMSVIHRYRHGFHQFPSTPYQISTPVNRND